MTTTPDDMDRSPEAGQSPEKDGKNKYSAWPFLISLARDGDRVHFEITDYYGNPVASYDSDDHSFTVSPEEAMANARLLLLAPRTAERLRQLTAVADKLMTLAVDLDVTEEEMVAITSTIAQARDHLKELPEAV
ncbi:MAG: hypothetical protein E6G97_18705 [Alphaproteobacteria bacterium]|nr:MAG: hypothetical protein E6G97_18705 [Alphaproteobacteria bacterium]